MPALQAESFRFWVVVPAAGQSRRMQSGMPKQYLSLAGRSVLEWALAPFLARSECAGVMVVLAAGDAHWSDSPLSRHSRIHTALGGQERADSVLAGVNALRDQCADSDWVLVHDAARPCLDSLDLQRLLEVLRDDPVGGLLAAPVVDTLKRADGDQRVTATVSRDTLWRAMTPQMFRYGVLSRALQQAVQCSVTITDESLAVELLGLQPRLVAGSADNLKITLSEDLARAERLLAGRPLE
jgi:2-C-methyl-D-erythritol 4-phosphate cytidylyltransferase